MTCQGTFRAEEILKVVFYKTPSDLRKWFEAKTFREDDLTAKLMDV
jgi:hypothetical protein